MQSVSQVAVCIGSAGCRGAEVTHPEWGLRGYTIGRTDSSDLAICEESIVGETIINYPPIWELSTMVYAACLYNITLVIWGMVYFLVYQIRHFRSKEQKANKGASVTLRCPAANCPLISFLKQDFCRESVSNAPLDIFSLSLVIVFLLV